MLKKSILIGLLAIGITACGSYANYQLISNSWRGATVDELISVWGYPDDKIVSPSNNEVFVYTDSRVHVISGEERTTSQLAHDSERNQVSHQTRTKVTPSQTIQQNCSTWFEISDAGIILSVSYRGDLCDIYPSRKEALIHPDYQVDDDA